MSQPAYQDNLVRFYVCDILTGVRSLPKSSVHCCVTSPPYLGLRSYLPADHPFKSLEVGCEASLDAYVERLVGIFREVGRVLRPESTLWLNLGDCYNSGLSGAYAHSTLVGGRVNQEHSNRGEGARPAFPGLKPKDLVGLPWRVAFALQNDGWYLRSEITLAKRNPMPQHVIDRPASATEKLFLLTKRPSYFYDALAARESAEYASHNLRDWWPLTSAPYAGSHYATFSPEIPLRCIRAGSSERGVCSICGAPYQRVLDRYDTGERGKSDVPVAAKQTTGWQPMCSCLEASREIVPATVLDPFCGSGTTLEVARRLGRRSIGLDLDERCTALLEGRMGNQEVMF